MQAMGAEKFFTSLPMNLMQFDLNSLSYAKDSKSFLIQIAQKFLTKGDLAFYVQYFLPKIHQLDLQRQKEKKMLDGSDIKAKKYETLIIQIWNLLPNFCHSNSPQLSQAFATLIGQLEPMVNNNVFGLRILALKVFSELIDYCRTTKHVDAEIK